MKNVFKILSLTVALGALIFTTSCSDDDGGGIIIDDGGSGGFQVADGLYFASVSGTDTTIVNANILNSAMIEGDGFAPTARDGHFAGYMYLTAGSYFFAEVDEQAVTSVEGGTSTFVDSVGTAGEAYTYVELEANGAAISLTEEGLYHVVYDNQERDSYVVKVNSWGVIGGAVYKSVCVSDGFNADVDLAEVSVSADGSSWEAMNVILRGGEYKFRYNNTWTIGSYKSFTNFGGTLAALSPGASNISNDDPGLYTISFAMSDDGTPSATVTKTGEAEECSFDAANFAWGIIGAATQGTETTTGWGAEKKLIYVGQVDGVDTWLGIFPMNASAVAGESEFKFRTDDTWATKLTSGTQGESVTVTNNTADGSITNNGDVNDDGSWFVESLPGGFLYVKISTGDQGGTWDLTFDEGEFQFIGEGSPVGNWDEGNGIALTYNDDLASVSGTGAFTTAGWKVFVNQSFAYNLGGALDGATALEFNNSTFNFDADGTYTVTITTADGGVTYTATAQ